MSSNVTEYRADFKKLNGDIVFRADSRPDKEETNPVPILVQAALINEDGVVLTRWVKPELEPYIGAMVDDVDPVSEPDILCIFAMSPNGDLLEAETTAGVATVEAFAVNGLGGVKQGCLLTVTQRDRDVLVIPATTNYKLERVCWDLNTHTVLYDNTEKHKGKRARLNA